MELTFSMFIDFFNLVRKLSNGKVCLLIYLLWNYDVNGILISGVTVGRGWLRIIALDTWRDIRTLQCNPFVLFYQWKKLNPEKLCFLFFVFCFFTPNFQWISGRTRTEPQTSCIPYSLVFICFLFLFFKFIFQLQLRYNVMLVSGIQHSLYCVMRLLPASLKYQHPVLLFFSLQYFWISWFCEIVGGTDI